MGSPLNTLDYLIRHLTEYGNTVLPNGKDEEYYLKLLSENGIECNVRRATYRDELKGKTTYVIFEVKGKAVPYKSNYTKYDMFKKGVW